MLHFWNAAEEAAMAGKRELRKSVETAGQRLAENDTASTRFELARLLESLGYFGAAVRVLIGGIAQEFDSPNLWWVTIDALNEAGDFARARKVSARARDKFPAHPEFYLADQLLLPLLYDSPEDIETVRRRFTQNLSSIAADPLFTHAENAPAARDGLSYWQNFYLAYQARDDRGLLDTYAAVATGVMKATTHVNPTKERTGHKIRIGFTSEFFRVHAVSNTFQGWVKYIDRELFETRLYHFVGGSEEKISPLAQYADTYFQLTSMDEMIQQIRADSLDILIYLDVGMTPAGTLPAALRLAPVQCATWGHPVTTGFPTIDYFISGESIEPRISEHHYTEKLVKLPGPGVTYDSPHSVNQLIAFQREAFGMRKGATVFLCSQSAFKYLPQHDWILAEIATQVPDCQFVFVITNRELAKRLLKRLDRGFRTKGLSVYDYAIVFPRMDHFLYSHVYALADIFLDTIGFSSFNTAIDAVTHDVPIVTMRGEFMRGCLASAVAEGVGLHELISDDVEGYIVNAVRLANDAQFRNSMIENIKTHRDAFFADRRPIRALEDFFRKAVSEARAASPQRG